MVAVYIHTPHFSLNARVTKATSAGYKLHWVAENLFADPTCQSFHVARPYTPILGVQGAIGRGVPTNIFTTQQ